MVASLFRAATILAFLSAALAAQHLQATADFDNGNTTTFELTNFDNQDSGSGNISKWNGQPVNIYVSWTRSTEGVVTITVGGDLCATLDSASQNSNEGGAVLNDPSSTEGKWERKT